VGAYLSNFGAELAVRPEVFEFLWLNSRLVSIRSAQIGPNQSVQIKFTILPDAGSYEIRVDRLTTTLTVSPSVEIRGGFSLWNLVWILLPLMMFIFVVVWRRRRHRTAEESGKEYR
jgi:hypothetical protein